MYSRQHSTSINDQESERSTEKLPSVGNVENNEQIKLRKALRESELLRELAELLASSLDPTHILQVLVRRTTEVCDVSRCAVWLLDKPMLSEEEMPPSPPSPIRFLPSAYHMSMQHMQPRLLQIADRMWHSSLINFDNPVIDRLLQAQGLLIVEDLRTQPGLERIADKFFVCSLLLVALIREGRVVGMMSLDNPGHETEFTQDQQQLARAIGQQAAVAIDNARLYQEAQAERQRVADLKARLLAEARHAMASSNERANTLNAIFNAMTEGILVLDQEGHIIASNNAAEKMLFWSEHVEQHTEEDQLLARSMQHSIQTYLRNYRITTLSGMPIPYEEFPLVRGLRGELIQGERFWSKKGGGTGNDIAMEITIMPLLDSDNKKIGIVSAFRDITEQVRNEQRLRSALTTMRESNAQKEEILAITAHEFRTPLTVILAHSQMILRVLNRTQDTNPQLKGRLLESNSCIEDQIRQLTNIVDTFLEVTRLNRGKLSLEHEPLDVVELIIETIANHRATSTIHQISYQAYPLGQPYFIYGDRARLLQVFDNLLQNAIKYSPQGGPITFTITLQDRRSPHATEATGETSLPPLMVDITIADQGIGVPPDAQSHLFECFYRAPNIVSTQARGVGLGLYVVSEFVHLHGGSIRVESSGIEGEGSCFIVSLPLLLNVHDA